MAALAPSGWWPVDKLIAGYLVASALLIAAFYNVVPGAALLLLAHAATFALILAVVYAPASRSQFLFHHWYSLPVVGLLYKEMGILIPAIRAVAFDQELARIDRAIWGADPTVWLERIHHPALTEFLQIVYTGFVPAVLLVAALLWRRGMLEKFRCYAFLVSMGFLASYVGYFIVPARGPRFLLRDLQHFELGGLWMFQTLYQTLDRLEAAHYDCFPSGHVEMTILAWWSSRQISRTLAAGFFVYTLCITFATIYLRYHYTIDLAAGALLAAGLIAVCPRLMGTAPRE